MRHTWKMLLPVGLLLALFPAVGMMALAEQPYTDVAILTTTDLHGKCWDEDLITEKVETNNLLRISTAVRQIREEYGEENVLLIDNGDLFQGTPVSQVQLLAQTGADTDDPPAMAVALGYIGYDAFVLGNHEFDYDWKVMRRAYDYLEQSGVPVLAANVCHDGSDPDHPAGENLFRPYIVRKIDVGGHPHKIGILGMENTDIEQWNMPENFRGMMFSHPGNESHSIAWEVQMYIPQMKAEGCEFIVVAYHGGLGDDEGEPEYLVNTDNQGLRLLHGTGEIDLLVLGHDHTSSYSNTLVTDGAGREVPIVNGGSVDLTKTVFRFTEDASGALSWVMLDSVNLELGQWEKDSKLEELIAPYAAQAEVEVDAPLGTLAGEWDENSNAVVEQTDTMDLVGAAMMEVCTRGLEARYGSAPLSVRDGAALDHLQVDMAMSNCSLKGDFVARAGGISIRDIYKLYQYSNDILVLPLYGREIRAIMEETAATRLMVRAYDGEVSFFSVGDEYTHILFMGLDHTIDMSAPEGERVAIGNFSNGRVFSDEGLYLVAVNSYLLGNGSCGLREYHSEDTIWSLREVSGGFMAQAAIEAYIRWTCEEQGAVTPENFNWKWSVEYFSEIDERAPEEDVAARLAPRPAEGHSYILCQEVTGMAVTALPVKGGLAGVACTAVGDALLGPLSEDAITFTLRDGGKGQFYMQTEEGRFLSCVGNGGLTLTAEPDDEGGSLWQPEAVPGGWLIVCEAENRVAMEYYVDRFFTYEPQVIGSFVFNFYEKTAE